MDISIRSVIDVIKDVIKLPLDIIHPVKEEIELTELEKKIKVLEEKYNITIDVSEYSLTITDNITTKVNLSDKEKYIDDVTIYGLNNTVFDQEKYDAGEGYGDNFLYGYLIRSEIKENEFNDTKCFSEIVIPDEESLEAAFWYVRRRFKGNSLLDRIQLGDQQIIAEILAEALPVNKYFWEEKYDDRYDEPAINYFTLIRFVRDDSKELMSIGLNDGIDSLFFYNYEDNWDPGVISRHYSSRRIFENQFKRIEPIKENVPILNEKYDKIEFNRQQLKFYLRLKTWINHR